ncbi:MAG: hypothetical protein IPM59_12660 [Chloracidobacterium sp.]|nr:hypothetical protein [Chloracidobacterium sp.]
MKIRTSSSTDYPLHHRPPRRTAKLRLDYNTVFRDAILLSSTLVLERRNLIFIILFLVASLGLGCAGSGLRESPEVKARADFARQYGDTFFIRDASFSTDGKERKTLIVSAISSRAAGDMSTTVGLLVSSDLKTKAKSLGFEEIIVVAHGDSWTDGATRRIVPLN